MNTIYYISFFNFSIFEHTLVLQNVHFHFHSISNIPYWHQWYYRCCCLIEILWCSLTICSRLSFFPPAFPLAVVFAAATLPFVSPNDPTIYPHCFLFGLRYKLWRYWSIRCVHHRCWFCCLSLTSIPMVVQFLKISHVLAHPFGLGTRGLFPTHVLLHHE